MAQPDSKVIRHTTKTGRICVSRDGERVMISQPWLTVSTSVLKDVDNVNLGFAKYYTGVSINPKTPPYDQEELTASSTSRTA
ncbi:MAG TPA: hypothetical protein VFW84_16515 [Aquabacterium sp.]|uniref:hypothetical protein n=1 Tax=Aquabacterium sp. TaxID=1872578 RepID=UPI002E34B957|nr:hypothetical protein [Aquabacterium sp.]HEX5374330.1 hypothetical protein [Aquabacterium sp.]